MTLSDLKDFYRTYYSPNNAFIVVAGDFDSEEILAQVRETFGKIPRGPEPPSVGLTEPPQQGERRVSLKKEAEFPVLIMNYHAPGVGHEDSYALDVLEMVLSRGRTSRLYRDLVYDRRIARYAYAGYHRVSIDPTTFSIGAQAMPGKETAELEAAIEEVIAAVREKGVTKAELDKARNQVAAAFIFAQESNRGQAMRIGFYELTGGWRRMNEYLQGIQGVTADDVHRVARQYLDPDRRTVGILVPQARKTLMKYWLPLLLCLLLGPHAAALAAMNAQRTTLPNGLVLVTSEQPALPIVTVRLLVRAGSRYDPGRPARSWPTSPRGS